MDGEQYEYFGRDVSWLSFNYRVLLEALDKELPLYERIKFVSIYYSNLEEFYEIRVAEHRGVIMQKKFADESAAEAEANLAEINAELCRQQTEVDRIIYGSILPELEENNIHLYFDDPPRHFHRDYIRNFFDEEVLPFLSPAIIQPGKILTFLRDKRLYLVVRVRSGWLGRYRYFLIKIPFQKVPRLVELPKHEGISYIMFIDDIIRANLPRLFPGYNVEDSYCIKISRDADLYFDDDGRKGIDIVSDIRSKVKKRKINDISRFIFDPRMPSDFLAYIRSSFNIKPEDLLSEGRHLNLKDLDKFPCLGGESRRQPPVPSRSLEGDGCSFDAIARNDILVCCPYQSFDNIIRILKDAAFDKSVEEIKITQYRVAENSQVINYLISAAHNGKKVTVFVELKARYDEENNMSAAEQMNRAGIKIIYSLPKLKVHAKVVLILRRLPFPAIACLSTGNFNEKTAGLYSDMALLTINSEIVQDLACVFEILEGHDTLPRFSRLLVAPFNMVDELRRMIRREIEHVAAGGKGRIILKMNGLHEREMINLLYQASVCGVEIDLIVRGICCLVPNRPYSHNIQITRIVDMYLEHSRVWYFFNGGAEDLYISSADWMRRNLQRRIETATPILDAAVKSQIIHILHLQLADNVKACRIDDRLNNIFKHDDKSPLRSQLAIREYLSENNR
ncbi:MAG: polyphosphate kinase 1 [Tannerellaceae bacterium]|jgi:polyphosphate kinase|nr:polyphosphate kinase 1 [Tannerellaceae bacterium]